ncbi:MAG: hypothetical protein CMJ49_05515 [Planctomycetaceae bacterium]|nr:hypothetical protein [Planctomycetaceae bacterium]
MAHLLSVDTWESQQSAAFTTHVDARELLVVAHPFALSVDDGGGGWSTTVDVASLTEGQAEWRPGDALYVSFYQSDNYSGGVGEGPVHGAQAFIGHRFKQLLVNDEVVWERDVADEELTGSPLVHEPSEHSFNTDSAEPAFADPYVLVDIGEQAAAVEALRITLRVLDKVASTTALPDDFYKRFVWSGFNPAARSR